MATLKTSPEANCDRQAHRQNDKATYRGSSYRSAQKNNIIGIISKVNLKIDEIFISECTLSLTSDFLENRDISLAHCQPYEVNF